MSHSSALNNAQHHCMLHVHVATHEHTDGVEGDRMLIAVISEHAHRMRLLATMVATLYIATHEHTNGVEGDMVLIAVISLNETVGHYGRGYHTATCSTVMYLMLIDQGKIWAS